MTARSLDEFRARPQLAPRARSMGTLQIVQQQAVRQSALTGDANWDPFLSYIEAAIAATERKRDAEDVKLRDPNLVNDEAMRGIKINLVRLEERIGALKEVLALPKFLKEQGESARRQIAEFSAEQK